MTQYWCDSNPLLTQITSPTGLVTKITYESDRRATSITNVTNPSTASSDSGTQYLPSSTDEEGRTTTYGYTAKGLLSSSTDVLNHGSSAVYNIHGHPCVSGTTERSLKQCNDWLYMLLRPHKGVDFFACAPGRGQCRE